MCGDLEAAREVLERHVCSSWACSEGRCRWLWALLLEAEGRPDQALNCFQESLNDHGSPAAVLAGTVRAAAACGDLSAARAVLPDLEVAAEPGGGARAALAEAEAWLANAEGRTCEAAIAFRTAAELYPGLYARTLMRLEAARLNGDCLEVGEALAIFERIGARQGADQARALALTLGASPARRPAAPNVLSSRELEVVQLIAAGHTNVEIAERLYLSPKTVERHVTNILAKLGLRSRVQVATEAVTGRLQCSAPAPFGASAEDPV
jgi:DNA-binding CsgD family transcriptional regulator